MTQLSMGYTPQDAGRLVWVAELEWARRAVAAIGAKEVCWALGVTESALSDALAERARDDKDKEKKSKRALRAEWLTVIRAMAPSGMQAEWLQIVSRPLGHEPKRIQVKTPEQRLHEREEWLARNASIVLAQMEKELGS